MIHSQAIIDPDAEIGENVSVGAFSLIGPNVRIADNTTVASHVVINGPTTIGSNNRIYQFCSIGGDPQDKKYNMDKNSNLVIGDGNTIREYCSINRGTDNGGGVTRIGNNNWIMAYVHIAHDCIIGNNTVFSNNATLAGHVTIDDDVILGGFTGVHQFCQIGRNCFSAISSVIVKDVPPYLMVSGNTAKPSGLNREGLKRHGYSSDTINLLRKAYKILYRKGLTTNQAIAEIRGLSESSDELEHFAGFIERSNRGIVR